MEYPALVRFGAFRGKDAPLRWACAAPSVSKSWTAAHRREPLWVRLSAILAHGVTAHLDAVGVVNESVGRPWDYCGGSSNTRLGSLTMPEGSGLSLRASLAPCSGDIRVIAPRGFPPTGTTSPRM